MHQVALSRALDDLEESTLLPARKVLYQFSARGHDVTQALLATQLTGARDAVGAYYRSRPLLLGLGLTVDEALASTMMRVGGMSEGRDIGVVFNLPRRQGACVLPACGGVGTQYTPAVGWAQALRYRRDVLGDAEAARSIAVAHGGDASTATNGFWAALNIATTERLPVLFYIEDNGYGISVPAHQQTPGGNIARNLAAFRDLACWTATAPTRSRPHPLIAEAVRGVRAGDGPALLRLDGTAPVRAFRPGHPDLQERPTPSRPSKRAIRGCKLRAQLVPRILAPAEWDAEVGASAGRGRGGARRASSSCRRRTRRACSVTSSPNTRPTVRPICRCRAESGPTARRRRGAPTSRRAQGPRINMVTAVRRTLEHELELNPRVLVFGEDVGRKGGVHAATLGLQEKFGGARVFDTSLSEEGIIGRAVGMAAAGLMPVPEIQFRKYADPAAEQLNDCGTMRWRTANRFAAPMVVRIPGRVLQMRRSLAQPVERSAVAARHRLAIGDALERRGCGRPAAQRAARQ